MSHTKNLSDLFYLFDIDVSAVENMRKHFHEEMLRGLSGQTSSLKMLPAFVTRSQGKESGHFLAIDLGGTNLRVLLATLDGMGNSVVDTVKKVTLSRNIMQGTTEELFDFIALCVSEFLNENDISKNVNYHLGFTFSFPVEQISVNSGKLIQWTKGFSIKDGINEDAVILLNKAFKRRQLNNIQISALVNDTVGTLMEESYSNSNCDMGVILGTGTNACYLEKTENIKKLQIHFSKPTMVIDMEWGDFNGYNGTSYDTILDETSINPGEQIFEKMVSGMYLGELSRLIICDMINKKFLFNIIVSHAFTRNGFLETEDMALVAADNTDSLAKTEEFLVKAGITDSTIYDRKTLKEIFFIVSKRAARIAAAAVVSVVLWMDPLLTKKHLIAVDGTVFAKYPLFKQNMEDLLSEYLKDKKHLINLTHTKDGSGKGAAITAAVAYNILRTNAKN